MSHFNARALGAVPIVLMAPIGIWNSAEVHSLRGAASDTMEAIVDVVSDRPTNSSPEVQAFLDTIAWAEGADYDVIVGGENFSDFSKHPGEFRKAFGVVSSAAGRYQFIDTTWEAMAKKEGLTDFTPESQDKAAIALLKQIGALDEIKSGDIDAAICSAGGQWASFPCNDWGQNPKTTSKIKEYYDNRLKELQNDQ